MIEGFVNNPEGEAAIKKKSRISTILMILIFTFLLLTVILLFYLVFYIKTKTISDDDDDEDEKKEGKEEDNKQQNQISERAPIIGITGMRLGEEETLYTSDQTQIHYIAAIEKAGGIPLSLPVLQNFNSDIIKRQVETVDAIIIQGGLDVNPELYGEEPSELLGEINKQTDDFLMEVIKQAEIRKIPILGICRGLQILNVYYHGSLYQDLSLANLESNSHRQNESSSCDFKHTITIEKNTYLKNMFPNKDVLYVNSYHHQAIKKLGDKLIVDAKAPDGIIESIHLNDENHWVFGTQFHPEQHLRCKNDFLPIFSELILQAKKKMDI